MVKQMHAFSQEPVCNLTWHGKRVNYRNILIHHKRRGDRAPLKQGFLCFHRIGIRPQFQAAHIRSLGKQLFWGAVFIGCICES